MPIYGETARKQVDGSTAGFYSLPNILDYIDGDSTLLEHEPLELLSAEGQLTAFPHHGFWWGMDTIWDKIVLNDLVDQATRHGSAGMTTRDMIDELKKATYLFTVPTSAMMFKRRRSTRWPRGGLGWGS